MIFSHNIEQSEMRPIKSLLRNMKITWLYYYFIRLLHHIIINKVFASVY